jgi:hypothetical protein
MLLYLIFCVSLFCLVLWPAAAALLWAVGLADDWRTAYRWGLAAAGLVWLIGVLDLVGRKRRGETLEPKGDEE